MAAVDIGPSRSYCLLVPRKSKWARQTRTAVQAGGRTRSTATVSSTRGTKQYNRVTEGEEQNAIRIARARKQSARVPQAPDWKVVPGHASAIPAAPPSQADPADTEGRRSRR